MPNKVGRPKVESKKKFKTISIVKELWDELRRAAERSALSPSAMAAKIIKENMPRETELEEF